MFYATYLSWFGGLFIYTHINGNIIHKPEEIVQPKDGLDSTQMKIVQLLFSPSV